VDAGSGQSRFAALLVRASVVLTIAAALAAIAHVCHLRSPWYDEFYTLYVTRPSFGWIEALREHWLVDNHPPLFYALARATAWLGETVEARRLLNLFFAGGALITGWALIRQDRTSRALAVPFVLMLAAQGAALTGSAEIRSYFLSFCAMVLVVLSLVHVWIGEGPPARRRMALLTGTALVAFNTHIATSLAAGGAFLPFVALAAWRRDWARLRLLMVPAMVGGLVFVATVAVQARLWVANTTAFWIPPGFDQARWSIEKMAQYCATANFAILAAAMFGFGLLGLRWLRERRMSAALEVAMLLGLGVVIALALMLAIHMWRPFIVSKYLIALIPGLAMVMALGFRETARAAGPAVGAGLVVASGLLTLNAMHRNIGVIEKLAGWNWSTGEVARIVRECPDTAVHVDPWWNRDLTALKPDDNARVIAWAYRHMAARGHFRVEPERSRRISASCPTLVWAEHVKQPGPDAAAILARMRVRGLDLVATGDAGMTLVSHDYGFVASNRALPPD